MVLSLKRLGFHGLQVRASTLSPHTYKPIHRHLYSLPQMVATCCSRYHGALPRCPGKPENPSPGCCKRGQEMLHTYPLPQRIPAPPTPAWDALQPGHGKRVDNHAVQLTPLCSLPDQAKGDAYRGLA